MTSSQSSETCATPVASNMKSASNNTNQSNESNQLLQQDVKSSPSNNQANIQITPQQHLASYTRQLNWLLLAIAIVPVIVLLPSESGAWNKNLVPFEKKLRLFDLMDFAVMGPFWFFALTKIRFIISDHNNYSTALAATKSVKSNKIFKYLSSSKRIEEWIELLCIAGFFYGHAIHFTGDSVNSYITEVHDYSKQVPTDVYELIYFLDEDMGHWLLFTCLFGLFGFWTVVSNVKSAESKASQKSFFLSAKPATIAGGFMGFTFSFGVIEGGSTHIGFACIVFLMFCSYWKLAEKSQSESKKTFLNHQRFRESYLMVHFSLSFALSMLVGLTSYYIVLEGFHQPSEIGGIHGVLQRVHRRLFV